MNKYLIAPDGSHNYIVIDEAYVPPEGYTLADTAPEPVPVPPSPREALRLSWMEQPVAIRAQFSSVYAAVNLALDQGDKELAVYLVNAAQVPPELEATKAQLLTLTENIDV